MSDTEREEGRASSRVAELTELEDKIRQAAELIGELRETNYSLSGEVAELRRELQSVSEGRTEGAAPTVSPTVSEDEGGASQAELDALRKERKAIRSKVVLLLERIEKLET